MRGGLHERLQMSQLLVGRSYTLAQVKNMFRDLGYDARVAYERGQPGAGVLEVRGGGLSRPIRFSGEMVMLRSVAEIKNLINSHLRAQN